MKTSKPHYSLCFTRGTVSVFADPSPEPGPVDAMSEQEACLALLTQPELLAALKGLVNMQRGREDWPEIRRAEAAIRRAEGA